MRLLLLAPLIPAGLIVLMVVDANLQHWLGSYWLPVAAAGLTCLSPLLPLLLPPLLNRPADHRRHHGACRCVYCNYDLGADRRNPNYCPNAAARNCRKHTAFDEGN